MVTFIGIDWADTKHDICALSVKGEILKEFIIPDTTSGYEQLHSFLQLHAPVQILIEKPNGLIVEFLLQHGYDTQWIPPSISASHRPRRSKSDTGDAFLLANLLSPIPPNRDPNATTASSAAVGTNGKNIALFFSNKVLNE